MKTLPSCICILGFAAAASVANADVLLDQIGAEDGTNIDLSNIVANQIFEAAFAQYSVTHSDDFDNPGGSPLMMVEFVMGGWNGYAGPDGISGYQVNVHAAVDGPCSDIAGDLLTYEGAGTAVVDWAGLTGLSLVTIDLGGIDAGSGNGLALAATPINEFGVNGQTGAAPGLSGDFSASQNNPAGGFGFGDCQASGYNAAMRITGGVGDPCSSVLPATCAADVTGPNDEPDGSVNVSDLLLIIGNWNTVGDGTFRPAGDCAPAPNGDCVVNVSDLLAVIGAWGGDCIARGSCCNSDGTCLDNVAEADCGAVWGGEGSDCASSCASGACCLTDGSCVTATADGCSGSYNGDGTDCADVSCTEAPANNDCSGSIALAEGDNAVSTLGTTTTGPAGDFTVCDNFGSEDIFNDAWYSYTASCDGDATFSVCNSIFLADGTTVLDTRIAAYDACGGTMIACNDDAAADCGLSSELILGVTAGTTYVIRLGSFTDGDTGSGTMAVSCAAYEAGACCIGTSQCVDGLIPPDCVNFGGTHQGGGSDCATVDCDPTPANDTCEGATEAVLGANAYDTSFAGAEWVDPDATACDGTFLDWGGSPDVYFSYTSTTDGSLTITTCDATSYDTSIAVYYGGCADGDGSHNVTCNGDAAGDAACQQYHSVVENLPVTAGQQVLIRCGGWNGATGAGTLTLSFTGGNETAACCVAGSCAGETTLNDCNALAGLWSQGETCATVSCPAPFAGCTGSEDYNEADFGCVCPEDGTDPLADCNAGLNGDGTETPHTVGDTVCGTASVFVAADGTTNRDTDWYDDLGVVDAGGTFAIQVGSGAAMLMGLVDKDAGAFIDTVINTAGFVSDPYDVTVAAGNHCIWVGPSDFVLEWTCDSGLAEYVFSVN
jgi:hypothetical protein